MSRLEVLFLILENTFAEYFDSISHFRGALDQSDVKHKSFFEHLNSVELLDQHLDKGFEFLESQWFYVKSLELLFQFLIQRLSTDSVALRF